MVNLCSFCVHYCERDEDDGRVCQCKLNNQEVHRWYVARKSCFSDRRKSRVPYAGQDRRRQWELPAQVQPTA